MNKVRRVLLGRVANILVGAFTGLIIAVYFKTELIYFVIPYFLLLYLVNKNQQNYFIGDTKYLDDIIYELFNESRLYLYIVSPYFYAGSNRIESIIRAIENDVKVTIIVNKKALISQSTTEELTLLQDKGCDIFVNPNLHSKIYLNEKEVITASVNLVNGSFDNSLEVGNYTKEIESLEQAENLIKDEYLAHSLTERFDKDNHRTGFCIRTKNIINYNLKSPIERNEYLSNRERNGKFCHHCGKESETNVSEPLCGDCK